MKKTLSDLIDSLSVTNIKIFMLIEKVQKKQATLEEAEKIQTLNIYRSKLMNAINEFSKEEKIIKV